ncbi:MAG: hypothetical protein KDC61_19340 [Saprospiraceae bacterium]|nr:hypothetical protein [Saprospiraceae bacterium]MCB0544421.1 hypothetical protein [Saprospiraceae bacterium]MCB0576722.1 hypothetical protein [Saprospiraceae bacterium]MCB9305250.1 hypothetical protein [Lewinellaceae bacterium]MCB9354395.1 hypothetical protein [Lewinellaceae bacterium]
MNLKSFLPVLLIGIFLCDHAAAQCINGTKSYPIYKKGAELVSAIDEKGMEIVRIEYDLIFTSKETFRQLTSDWEYVIFAFADDGVKDVDLKIYEYDSMLEKYTLVKKDNSTEGTAVLSIKPEKTGLYKIEVIAYEFHEGYNAARYGLFIVHE